MSCRHRHGPWASSPSFSPSPPIFSSCNVPLPLRLPPTAFPLLPPRQPVRHHLPRPLLLPCRPAPRHLPHPPSSTSTPATAPYYLFSLCAGLLSLLPPLRPWAAPPPPSCRSDPAVVCGPLLPLLFSLRAASPPRWPRARTRTASSLTSASSSLSNENYPLCFYPTTQDTGHR